jgi:uncharacterized lipoprotein YmbA
MKTLLISLTALLLAACGGGEADAELVTELPQSGAPPVDCSKLPQACR